MTTYRQSLNFAAVPVVAALVLAVGTAADATLVDGTGTYSQTITNNNNLKLVTKINEIRTALITMGVIE